MEHLEIPSLQAEWAKKCRGIKATKGWWFDRHRLMQCSCLWRVWCDECKHWHTHGAMTGHRAAHCGEGSRYEDTGYNLIAPKS